MKKWLKILFVLIMVIISIVSLSNLIVIKLLEKPQITSIAGISLENIVVDSELFVMDVKLNSSAFCLHDYVIEEKDNEITISIFSRLTSSDLKSNWVGNQITYDKNLTNIDSISLLDKESKKEIWNRRQGLVWK